MNRVQLAAGQIKTAIDQLEFALANLRHVKNDQHIPIAMKLMELKEIHAILNDPEETPEIAEGE